MEPEGLKKYEGKFIPDAWRLLSKEELMWSVILNLKKAVMLSTEKEKRKKDFEDAEHYMYFLKRKMEEEGYM